ncbi:MAG: DUF2058 domain-containing protein [Thiolinea sp.]
MASLQDQLLKAGLVDKKKAQATRKAKNKQDYQSNKGQQQTEDEAALLAEQARSEQAARSRELNKQRQQEAEHHAIQAQIRQLITLNRIDRSRGDSSYQFADGNKVQSIYVTDTLRQRLSDGILVIVRLQDGYELVSRQVADKIAQRDPEVIVLRNDSSHTLAAEDDPYADFQVPDDLMW